MEFKRVSESYIDEAVKLAMIEYGEECNRCPQLIQDDFTNRIRGLITELFKSQYGMAAFQQGKLIGYLAFWNPCEQFFGVNKGVFSPLGGNAFAGNDRGKLASLLFQKIAEELVEDGVTSIAICRYAHDEETKQSLIFNGFGIRCSDAIRSLNIEVKIKSEIEGISFFELAKKIMQLSGI